MVIRKTFLTLLITTTLTFYACEMSSQLEDASFSLLGAKEFSGQLFKKNKGTVFCFFSPDCPLSENYTLPINELSIKYQSESILFYNVFSGTLYSESKIDSFVKTYQLKPESILDDNYQLKKYLDATITPEVFLLDSNLNVVYRGKIDDWIISLGKKKSAPTQFYLEDAINSYLEGRAPKIPSIKAIGCFIE